MPPKNQDDKAETPVESTTQMPKGEYLTPTQGQRAQEKKDQEKPESSETPMDKGKGINTKQTPELSGHSSASGRRRTGFNAPYVPRGRREQEKREPGKKTGYLFEMQRRPEAAGKHVINKGYDDINIGDVFFGPCYGLSIFSKKIGTSKITEHVNLRFDPVYDGRARDSDAAHHPHIVIGKNNRHRTIQTVMCTTFEVEVGGTLADRRYLDVETACKYFVPVHDQPHEEDHIRKGQPDFTVKYGKDPVVTLTEGGEKSSGWACIFMFFNVTPKENSTTRKLRFLDDVHVTRESITKLQEAIDSNESERIKFIQENFQLFRDQGNHEYNIRKLMSRVPASSDDHEVKEMPTSEPSEKDNILSGPVADASKSSTASHKTSRGSSRGRGNSSRAKRGWGRRGRGGGSQSAQQDERKTK